MAAELGPPDPDLWARIYKRKGVVAFRDYLKRIHFDEVALSTRALNCLSTAGIKNLGQLFEAFDHNEGRALLKVRGLGWFTWMELSGLVGSCTFAETCRIMDRKEKANGA